MITRVLAGVALGLIFFCEAAFASTADHIGPDPIQSDNCLIITPQRSIVCNGHQLKPDSVITPTVAINCNPGIFFVITHAELPESTSGRQVVLTTAKRSLTQQWLAVSATQSAVLVFYDGTQNSEFASMLRFIGHLLESESSGFTFTIGDGATAGEFRLTYADRQLLSRIASSC